MSIKMIENGSGKLVAQTLKALVRAKTQVMALILKTNRVPAIAQTTPL